MARQLVFIACILLLTACGGRVDAETNIGVDRDVRPATDDKPFAQLDGKDKQPPGPTGFEVIAHGNFIDAAHEGTGNVQIVRKDGLHTLTLNNFKTDRGPDLRVYISTDLQATKVIDLGRLQSASGDQTYSVPGFVDTEEYKYVLVWCRAFKVLFTSAELS